MPLMQSAKGAIDLGISGRKNARKSQIRGIVIVICALLTAGVSFTVLIGLTPVQPSDKVTLLAIAVNGIFVFALLWLIGTELYRIYAARKAGKAASRLHVRIVGLFALVAAVPAIVIAAVSIPVTVKSRIGVDDQDPETALFDLARQVADAGTDAIWVHARKAWLEGLSPKENRDVPPLDYTRVHRLKQRLPRTFVGINGGIVTADEAVAHLDHVDGVMLGRAAYHSPAILAELDARLFGDAPAAPRAAVEAMLPYIAGEFARGTRLSHITRHMLGLFHGAPGARAWRRILTVGAVAPGAGLEVVREALDAVSDPAPRQPGRADAHLVTA